MRPKIVRSARVVLRAGLAILVGVEAATVATVAVKVATVAETAVVAVKGAVDAEAMAEVVIAAVVAVTTTDESLHRRLCVNWSAILFGYPCLGVVRDVNCTPKDSAG
jgi:hypothetical protein